MRTMKFVAFPMFALVLVVFAVSSANGIGAYTQLPTILPPVPPATQTLSMGTSTSAGTIPPGTDSTLRMHVGAPGSARSRSSTFKPARLFLRLRVLRDLQGQAEHPAAPRMVRTEFS
jgi:hypothetical protein